MGKAPHHKNRGTKGLKGFKVARRAKFLGRGIDQVWEDVRAEEPVHDGKAGPQGTTSRVEHDEDVAGFGQFFCVPCSKYCQTLHALTTHQKSKLHKKRVKELKGDRPHNQADAEKAAGMGTPDNGAPIRSDVVPQGMAF
uniref:C2H2-type domain-containing protein n=1 Tax=Pyramimonas obovata TaxID=1411642 RepID=A0A7S0WNS7_9CHLO|mmetsp:Transcript_32436/g.70828  ORF Transcript_32436/g.70828 Transcript_32436/m.70828 type:complete len:139 (+) Transcript_32436:373-789(+)